MSAMLLPYQFNCSLNETMTNNYHFTWNSSITPTTTAILPYLESCGESVVIPVWQSTARAMLTSPDSITLSEALNFGFGLKWNANNSLCDQCERSQGVCGHDDRTMQFICYCPDRPYPFTSPPNQAPTGSLNLNLPKKVAIGVLSGVVGIGVISVLFYMHGKPIFFLKKQMQNDQDVDAVIRKYGSLAPKGYNYSDVKKMTNSFSDKVRQGGCGVVYRGKLHEGRVAAVKVLSESKGNGEEFINEVACISGTSHVNIVTPLGFCCEGNKRALVYEFMPNGSLHKFIYDKGSMSTKNNRLEWTTLSEIVVGVAPGLECLIAVATLGLCIST